MNEMVKGLNKFLDTFKDYSNNYIIVGGTATIIALNQAALSIRTTKDIDMVVIVEKLSYEFGKAFWDFIKSGGYSMYHSKDNKPHYYRFINKNNKDYPYMIELFSRKQELFKDSESLFMPIIIDEEISSLSAIMLDDVYYNYLIEGKTVVDGLSVLDFSHLISFKARAHVDLMNKKNTGFFVNEMDSRKHKNDIFRLVQLLSPTDAFDVPDIVKKDLNDFISIINAEDVDMKALTNNAISFENAVALLKKVYNL